MPKSTRHCTKSFLPSVSKLTAPLNGSGAAKQKIIPNSSATRLRGEVVEDRWGEIINLNVPHYFNKTIDSLPSKLSIVLFAFQFLKFLHLLCCKELIYSAQMLTDLAMAELIDLCHQPVKEITVVAHTD